MTTRCLTSKILQIMEHANWKEGECGHSVMGQNRVNAHVKIAAGGEGKEERGSRTRHMMRDATSCQTPSGEGELMIYASAEMGLFVERWQDVRDCGTKAGI